MREPPSTSPVASDRKAVPPEHRGGPGRKLPHLLILVAACIGATVATYTSHWHVRSGIGGKMHSFGTISLSALMDVPLNPPDTYDNEVLERCASSPDFKRFCYQILERSQGYRSSTQAPYDVQVSEYGFPHGWPLTSRHRYAMVYFYERSLGGAYSGDQFWVDYEGEDPPPILYPGLVGNWLFYFASSLLLLEIVYRIAMTLWSRITAPRPATARPAATTSPATSVGFVLNAGPSYELHLG
jgi:hypothetical protein